jgi:putative membrane protein
MLPTAVTGDPPADWQARYDYMMWGSGYGMVGGLMMLLFWGVVIVLVVLAVRWFADNRSGENRGKRDAIDILRERFAAGEIDEEEFENRKKVLEG